MKLTSTIVIASIMSTASAAGGNLRVARSIVASENQETTSSNPPPAAKTVHKKENQNNRKLPGIQKPRTNTLAAAQPGSADATREKRRRMKEGVIVRKKSSGEGYNKALHATSPMHNLKFKEPSQQQSQPEGETQQDNDNINSNNNFDVNIVGGEQSDPGEFPYYVDMNGCGGTLIGPDVVLSAAHCGSYFGETVTIGGITVEVIQEQIHPNYNFGTQENDFYLHKLMQPVDISSGGVSLMLNTDGFQPVDGQALTTLGLGLTSEGGSAPSSLRDVVVPTVSDIDCADAYGSGYVASSMLCAGEGGKDSCQGDSGGPLVIRNGATHVLVGVVSFGVGCADPDYPGVYSRVSSAIDWIRSVACDGWNSNVSGLCDNNGGTTSPPTSGTQSPTATGWPTDTSGTVSPTGTGWPSDSSSSVSPTDWPTGTTPPMGGSSTLLTVEFRTDNWPEETIILLRDASWISQDYRNLYANSDYSFSEYIPDDGCTVLDVTDTYGDGLLNGGFLKVTYGSAVMHDDWNFGYGFYIFFGNGCS